MDLNYINKFEIPVITTQTLDEFDRDGVLKSLSEGSFACIRGLFSKNELLDVLNRASKEFDKFPISPSMGESRNDIRNNFCKLNLGGASLRYNNYPRFFKTFYNPTWEKDIFGMRQSFQKLIMLRNKIYGVETGYALDKIEENGLFSATRLQQYPSGGGFFSTHRDTTLLDVAEEKNINFFQLILVISEKGKHFQSGGAYLDKNSQRYMLEDQVKTGDVLIYDGSSLHGVEEIDPHQPLKLAGIEGRIVALASLYSV